MTSQRLNPFFVTFVSAILSLKSFARGIKRKLLKPANRLLKQGNDSFLKSIQNKSAALVSKVRKGAHVFGAALPDKYSQTTGNIGSPDILRPRSSSSSNLGNKSPIIQKVEKHLETFHRHIGSKNAKQHTLKSHALQYSSPIVETPPVPNYITGTPLSYGCTVALQAKHGGFLSFHKSESVRASAHKILSASRFVIINSDQSDDTGPVRYGDAVLLQVGHHEVLGADFSSSFSVGTLHRDGTACLGGREMRPVLINCRGDHLPKAEQYGRWIVLKKEDTMESFGKVVMHRDVVLLEQDWYFMGSLSPYDSVLYKTKVDESQPWSGNKASSMYFQPPSQCWWTLHLALLAVQDSKEEAYRQKLELEATFQLKRSEKSRSMKQGTLALIRNYVPPVEEVCKMLAHKTTDEADNMNFRMRWKKNDRRRFSASNGELQLQHLKKTYGNSSPIVSSTRETMRIRAGHNQRAFDEVKMKPGSCEPPQSQLDLRDEEYWKTAQSVLVDTRVYTAIPHLMALYEREYDDKRDAAAKIIQRFFRLYSGDKLQSRIRMIDERLIGEIVRIKEEERKEAQLAKKYEEARLKDRLDFEVRLKQPASPSRPSTAPSSFLPSPQSVRNGESGRGGTPKRSIAALPLSPSSMRFLIQPVTSAAVLPAGPSDPSVMTRNESSLEGLSATYAKAVRCAVNVQSVIDSSSTAVEQALRPVTSSELYRTLSTDLRRVADQGRSPKKASSNLFDIAVEAKSQLLRFGIDGVDQREGDNKPGDNETSLSKHPPLNSFSFEIESIDELDIGILTNLAEEESRRSTESSKRRFDYTSHESPQLGFFPSPTDASNVKAKPSLLSGLPEDMFEDVQGSLSLKCGIKFLRASSSPKSKIYDDLIVTNRRTQQKLRLSPKSRR